MIPYCYHTHTKRCGHAIGEDEEYVLEAIAAGVRKMGFSDHIMLPSFSQPGIRGDYALLDDYLNSVKYLKEKYKDKIKISCGFEAEYSPNFVSYYKLLLESGKIDYLILGQHFNFSNNTVLDYYGHIHDKEQLFKYRDQVVEAMSTGLFSFLAHPDLYMSSYEKFDVHAKNVAMAICKASLEYNIPLEINLAGIRKGLVQVGNEKRYLYPYLPFWKVVAKYKCKVIIGVDAHNPHDFTSNEYSIALKIIRELGLNHDQNFVINNYKN